MVSNFRLTLGDKKYNKLYFLHIPKSGGRYLNKIAIHPISKMLVSKDIQWVNPKLHEGWISEIDDSTYIVSIVRDPIRLFCSWFLFFSDCEEAKDLDLNSIESLNKTKRLMFNFLVDNPWIYNFQSKHFLCNYSNIPMSSAFDFSDIDLQELTSRSNRVNLLFSQDLLKSNPYQVCKRIFEDLELHPSKMDLEESEEFSQKSSSILYDSLSDKEIGFIRNYFNIDYYLYNAVRNKELGISV
jgi:hypothetical protein